MAIDTINEKLAIMEFGQVWEPGLPISPGTLGQDDKQQLLWGFPGVLWDTLVQVFNWVIPTNATDGQQATIIIFDDDGVTTLEDGTATAASGIWEFQASTGGLSNGDKKLAFWHQWDLDPETQSIFGGAAIAEAVEQ